MLQAMRPQDILELPDDLLTGVARVEDVQGLDASQAAALRLRLARRAS